MAYKDELFADKEEETTPEPEVIIPDENAEDIGQLKERNKNIEMLLKKSNEALIDSDLDQATMFTNLIKDIMR